MKIFDFNIHLPQKISADVNDVIEDDLNLTVDGLVMGFRRHHPSFMDIAGINVLLFNQKLFHQDKSLAPFLNEVNPKVEHLLMTALIDFRDTDVNTYIETARDLGVRAFMFNSYLQHIAENDFESVLQICRFAEENSIAVCIDGSYGTSKMYTYDNMKLACFVSDHISKVPIVVIHSGGYRIMEAMLLAMDKRNVFLDTSFSLNYYLGSSLEQDYAFAYKRLGSNRVLFGSDVPYMNFQSAHVEQLEFFHRHGFNISELADIFYNNALRLVNGDWK